MAKNISLYIPGGRLTVWQGVTNWWPQVQPDILSGSLGGFRLFKLLLKLKTSEC